MSQLCINNLTIELVKKNIKNLHLGVYPPDGRVRVAAPLGMDDDRIRLFIIAKTSWIRKHQAKFHQQDREPQREYIDGESHYFWGQRYLLKIIEKNQKPSITIYRKKYIIMTIRPNTSPQQREAIMRGRYRHELTKHITPLITQRSQKMKVNPQSRHIKRMKTKRGTCNTTAGRIRINEELAKKPEQCLEYIIVHELAHLIEASHNKAFWKLMDTYLPQWRKRKNLLNTGMLSV